MKSNARILKDHPAFAHISTGILRKLTENATIETYPKGTEIYRKGDMGDALYVLLTGRCQAEKPRPDGSTHVFRIYVPGSSFGERSMMARDRHRTTARVVTDAVAMRIPGEDALRLIEKYPAFARPVTLRVREQLKHFSAEVRLIKMGRVSAMTSVFPDERMPCVAESVAATLRGETMCSVLLLHVMKAGESPEPRTDAGETYFGQTAGLLDGVTKSSSGVRLLTLHLSGDEESAASVPPLIGQLSEHFRYVLILVDQDVPGNIASAFLVQSDLAYVLFRQTSDDMYRAHLLGRQVIDAGQPASHVLPVVCLEEEERALSFEEMREEIDMPVHRVMGLPRLPGEAGDDSPRTRDRYRIQVRHLAREIGRCRIGLALSSGGAKALAHIGVIQVLEENGVQLDAVSGTSMGAFVGAMWAYGLSGRDMEELAAQLERPMSMLRLVDPAIPPRRGWMKGGAIRKWLAKAISDAQFSDNLHKLFVTSADLDTIERVVFESGSVADAVHASMAMPGVIVPVELNGRTLIDGGAAEPVPVNPLLDIGVEHIIAVNTIPNPDEMRACVMASREQAERPRRRRKKHSTFDQYINYFAPGNILDVMMKSMHGGQSRMAEYACSKANLTLRPVSCDGKWNDFGSPRRYIAIGRAIAEERLDDILALARLAPRKEAAA